MARKVKINSNTLISLIDQYYAEKCDYDVGQLKIPKIGEYVRSKGYDVADYLIRRNEEVKSYIKKLKESIEEIYMHTVVVYRDIDMDAFLMKNNTKEKLKKVLKDRENYYREVTNSASYSFKENKSLKQQVKELKKQIIELEQELKTAVSKSADISSDNRKYKVDNRKLREIIDTYVYPEIANKLLEKQGLLKNSARIVNPEVIENELVTAETDVTEIKSTIIKGLFDSI